VYGIIKVWFTRVLGDRQSRIILTAFWAVLTGLLLFTTSTLGSTAITVAMAMMTVVLTSLLVFVSRSPTEKPEEVTRRYAEARLNLGAIEKQKAELDAKLLETNRQREFRLRSLDLQHDDFFADFIWSFNDGFNLLLGKNGYGKSYVLHGLAGLLTGDYAAMSALFPTSDPQRRIGLKLCYRSVTAGASMTDGEILFNSDGLHTEFGPVPTLALPDLRFIDRSTMVIGAPQTDTSDVVASGARLFLHEQPIVGLVQTMLYQICFDSVRERTLKLPVIAMLERVLSELTEAKFEIKEIAPRDEGRFAIMVVAEGIADRPMPLQRASQGTLSTVAMFGLIERFLRGLRHTSVRQDVCDRTALVIIDELDAHLHPSWQRRITGLLGSTFPNVQFIASGHSPLLVAGRLEDEVAVLRKTRENQFIIEPQPLDFIGEDVTDIMNRIFDTDATDETLRYYVGLQPEAPAFEDAVERLEALANRSPVDEAALARALTELDRINRAKQKLQRTMRVRDLAQQERAVRSEVARLTKERDALKQEAGKSRDVE
jgi:hypothetical protein